MWKRAMSPALQESKRIFGIGRVLIDHAVVVPSYPDVDTKTLVQDHWRQIGGPVPVALSTAAHFGIETSFAGPVGDDADGQHIMNELSTRQIDMTHCKPSGTTGFAQIWTEQSTGRRTIAACPGREISDSDVLRLDEAIDRADVVHTDGSSSSVSIYAARRTKERDGMVVLDAGSKKPGMESLFPLVDLLVASDLFCKSWFGRAEVPLTELLSLGCRTVVRTLGADGAVYVDGQQELHEAAVTVKPVDTNGAGDIFCGAFLVGIAKNWEPKRCLKFANSVAGYSCGFKGNTSLPTP